MSSLQLPPELWDIILSFLSEIDISVMAFSRLLLSHFNELILNNRNMKRRLLLAERLVENGVLSRLPIEQFWWSCECGHLNVAKWLVSIFNLNVTDARSRDNLALRYACKNGNICS